MPVPPDPHDRRARERLLPEVVRLEHDERLPSEVSARAEERALVLGARADDDVLAFHSRDRIEDRRLAVAEHGRLAIERLRVVEDERREALHLLGVELPERTGACGREVLLPFPFGAGRRARRHERQDEHEPLHRVPFPG